MLGSMTTPSRPPTTAPAGSIDALDRDLTLAVLAYQLIEAARQRLLGELRHLVHRAQMCDGEVASLARARVILLTQTAADGPGERQPEIRRRD